jgi:hypothetical protein
MGIFSTNSSMVISPWFDDFDGEKMSQISMACTLW